MMNENRQQGELHLPGFHLATEILRRSPHHHAADEDADNNVQKHVDHTDADTAEGDVEPHADHRHESGEGVEAVMQCAHTPVARRPSRQDAPLRRPRFRTAVPYLLDFRRFLLVARQEQRWAHFRNNWHSNLDRQQCGMTAKTTTACRHATGNATEHPHTGHRYQDDGDAFDDIGEKGGIFKGWRGIGPKNPPPLVTQLLDRHERRRRPESDGLRIPSRVVATADPCNVMTTPPRQEPLQRWSPTSAIQRKVARIRSEKKLPKFDLPESPAQGQQEPPFLWRGKRTATTSGQNLREITQRYLAGIVLKVSVRRKGSVVLKIRLGSSIPCHPGSAEAIAEATDHVHDDKHDRVEQQHGKNILLPICCRETRGPPAFCISLSRCPRKEGIVSPGSIAQVMAFANGHDRSAVPAR